MNVHVECGDCREVLASMEPDSFAATVTDPPYHLVSIVKRFANSPRNERTENPLTPHGRTGRGFMGKTWDGGDVAFRPETWAAVLRVLKPGAYLVAFASTRGYHRMVCAIEDAGFIIHPMLGWIFASGFPKAHRVHAEGWEGWRYGLQSLKPALEPICLAQKPMSEPTGTANILRWGTGAVNIDGCRVGTGGEQISIGRFADSRRRQSVKEHDGWDRPWKRDGENWAARGERAVEYANKHGRWPANLAHDGSPEVMEAFARFGERATGSGDRRSNSRAVYGEYNGGDRAREFDGDSGTAARFFKSCKHSQDELLFSRAKTIIDAWNKDLANTADNSSRLPSEHAASVLSDAVLLASSAGSALSDCQGLGTSVTPSELNDLATMLIVEILSIGSGCLRAPPRGKRIPIESPASYAEAIEPTGTIRITISHWKSDGSADAAIFEVILLNSADGADTSGGANRFHFCGKAQAWEREGDHPTVKPVALMEWLIKLVTPPGGTVLDPFCGTGSTLVACDWLGIDALGIDDDPKTCIDAENKVKRLRARRMLGEVERQAPLLGQLSLL